MRRTLYQNLRDGLVGAWSPAAQSRTVGATGYMLPDLSGRGNHGTLTNMTPATDWTTSNGYGGLNFTGLTTHVSTYYNPLPELSISMWVTPAASTNLRAFLLARDGNTEFSGVIVFIYLGKWQFWATTNGSTWGTALTGTSTPGGLTHLFCTYRSGYQSLSVNGKVEAESTNTGAISYVAGRTWKIGGHSSGASWDVAGVVHDTVLLDRPAPNRGPAYYQLGPGGWAAPRRRRSYVMQAAAPAATRSSFKTLALCR